MNKANMLSTVIAGSIGLVGCLFLLYAWQLPPFSHAKPFTENAYVRGNVTPIAPRLAGYLQSVDMTDFQPVKAGDLLATIDDSIYRQKLVQAQAALEAALAAKRVATQTVESSNATLSANEAAIIAAEAAVDTAQSNVNRTRTLSTRGATSQQTNDQAELTLKQAVANLNQAEAQVSVQKENIHIAEEQLGARQADIDTAMAQVELSKIDLSHTEIRAPADGHLGQISVHTGQYVSAGSALASHVGKDLWVIANFKEGNIDAINVGDKVTFTVDALKGRKFTGKVASFSPATASEFSVLAASNATGNFTKIAQRLPTRITIDPDQNGIDRLTPGMSVEVTVDGGS